MHKKANITPNGVDFSQNNAYLCIKIDKQASNYGSIQS